MKETAEQRRIQREQERLKKKKREKEEGTYNPEVLQRKLSVPKNLKAIEGIDPLISQLQEIKQEVEVNDYDELDISFELLDSPNNPDNSNND